MMNSDLLTLSWDSHTGLLAVFEKLLDSNSLVDCTLTAEGQYLKAHKVILSACSPYFELLFSIENEKQPIIFFKDVKFQELKDIIDFVYRGQVNIPESRLAVFLEAAECLQINGIGKLLQSDRTKRSASDVQQSCVNDGRNSPVHKRPRKGSGNKSEKKINEKRKAKDSDNAGSSYVRNTEDLPQHLARGAVLTSVAASTSLSDLNTNTSLNDEEPARNMGSLLECSAVSDSRMSDEPYDGDVIKTELDLEDVPLPEHKRGSDSADDLDGSFSSGFQFGTESDMRSVPSDSKFAADSGGAMQSCSKTGGAKCAYKNCRSTSVKNPELSFFRFPVKHKERCLKWMANSGNDDLAELSDNRLRSRVLCSLHFTNTAFTNSLKNRLLQNHPSAVPVPWNNDVPPQGIERVILDSTPVCEQTLREFSDDFKYSPVSLPNENEVISVSELNIKTE